MRALGCQLVPHSNRKHRQPRHRHGGAGDIYKNNTAYTNPDYVLEKYFTGDIVKFKDKEGAFAYSGLQPLENVREFARTNYGLPLMRSSEGGIFGKGDALLASLEESYLYLFELNDRLTRLEEENAGLKARLEALEVKGQ